tara:strand:+ start:232 stop:993 length:762 start_codon:yes stop_codon:yes gene_type:complete
MSSSFITDDDVLFCILKQLVNYGSKGTAFMDYAHSRLVSKTWNSVADQYKTELVKMAILATPSCYTNEEFLMAALVHVATHSGLNVDQFTETITRHMDLILLLENRSFPGCVFFKGQIVGTAEGEKTAYQSTAVILHIYKDEGLADLMVVVPESRRRMVVHKYKLSMCYHVCIKPHSLVLHREHGSLWTAQVEMAVLARRTGHGFPLYYCTSQCGRQCEIIRGGDLACIYDKRVLELRDILEKSQLFKPKCVP